MTVSSFTAHEVHAAADRLVRREGKRRMGETAALMHSLAIAIELHLPDEELWKRDCAYMRSLMNASSAQ